MLGPANKPATHNSGIVTVVAAAAVAVAVVVAIAEWSLNERECVSAECAPVESGKDKEEEKLIVGMSMSGNAACLLSYVHEDNANFDSVLVEKPPEYDRVLQSSCVCVCLPFHSFSHAVDTIADYELLGLLCSPLSLSLRRRVCASIFISFFVHAYVCRLIPHVCLCPSVSIPFI